jgi:hypothetical protein
VGAHGTVAVVVDLGGDAPAVTGRVSGGTPDAALGDLDGDGLLDVALRQTTAEPSYAAAPRYWQTFRDTGGPGPRVATATRTRRPARSRRRGAAGPGLPRHRRAC